MKETAEDIERRFKEAVADYFAHQFAAKAEGKLHHVLAGLLGDLDKRKMATLLVSALHETWILRNRLKGEPDGAPDPEQLFQEAISHTLFAVMSTQLPNDETSPQLIMRLEEAAKNMRPVFDKVERGFPEVHVVHPGTENV